MPNIFRWHSVTSELDRFCNGDEGFEEWRVMSNFGMAGKIWNGDTIYVTGHSSFELTQKAYEKELKMIEEWNKEIEVLLTMYSR